MTSKPRTKNRQRNYDIGYKLGYRGLPMNPEHAKLSVDYAEGWDDGNCDRPTLDDLLPLDARKEATSWWT